MNNRQILHIALPSIVSNITVPLLGLFDVAIVGHLGAPAYIGAIAVGGMLFNVIYWIFAFLRMGTSGMTSQALGKRNLTEVMQLLVRSLCIGLAIALGLIILQTPLRHAAFLLIHPTEEVRRLATIYFHICIWGAPAMLALYGLTGWYIGMQNTRIPMYIAITQNLVNILASLTLVLLGGLKVEGVALGTLIAQYAGLLMGLLLWKRHYGRLKKHLRPAGLWQRAPLLRFFTVNRDLFLRTLCLVTVTLYFTSAGATQGEVILAVNTLLMQLFLLFSYVMDGFANAGEALSGRCIGARQPVAFRRLLRLLFGWGAIMATLFTLTYQFGGSTFLRLLTDDASVIAASAPYFPWAVAIPFAGITAFVWDSLYIGATATRGMLQSMFAAAAAFFLLYFGLRSSLGNHALWLAFLSYLFVRGAVQTILAKGVFTSAFQKKD